MRIKIAKIIDQGTYKPHKFYIPLVQVAQEMVTTHKKS